jgi:hypothetical protein
MDRFGLTALKRQNPHGNTQEPACAVSMCAECSRWALTGVKSPSEIDGSLLAG